VLFSHFHAAFESSADDTAVAVVRSDRTVLSNVVIKQHAQCVSFSTQEVRALICSHEQYGGIQPIVAISWHQRNLVRAHTSSLPNPMIEYTFCQPFAVKRALEGAKMKAVDVDGIAFTRGPGREIVKKEKYVLIVWFRDGWLSCCLQQCCQISSSCFGKAHCRSAPYGMIMRLLHNIASNHFLSKRMHSLLF